MRCSFTSFISLKPRIASQGKKAAVVVPRCRLSWALVADIATATAPRALAMGTPPPPTRILTPFKSSRVFIAFLLCNRPGP